MVLVLVVIAAVSAASISDFKAPEGFTDWGDGFYVSYDGDNPDQFLSIVEYSQENLENYTANDTQTGQTVYPYENNTYNFVVNDMDEKGSFEMVEVDGVKFIIAFEKAGIGDKNDFNETFDNLMKFNELNGLTPIPIEG